MCSNLIVPLVLCSFVLFFVLSRFVLGLVDGFVLFLVLNRIIFGLAVNGLGLIGVMDLSVDSVGTWDYLFN